MTVVQMPDGVQVDFGDRSPDQIRALILQKFPNMGKPAAPDQGAAAAGAMHWANQTLGGFGPQVAGAIQGALDVTGLDQHRGGADRAQPGMPQPQTPEELAAAMKNGPRPIQSIGSFSGGYDQTVNDSNAALDTTAAQHPVASTVGDIGGGVTLAGMVPAGGIARGLGIAGKAGTMAAKVGEGFAGGLGYGAIAGAGNARGGIGDRIQGGLEGALTGGVGGGVAAPVGAAVGALGRAAFGRPLQAVNGILSSAETEAARRVTGGLKADLGDPYRAVTGMEQAQKAGQPIIAADMGETSAALADSAAITSPPGRAILTKALDDRAAGRLDRVTSVIESAAPGINAPATRDFLEQAAAKANKPRYNKAYQDGESGVWNEGLRQLTVSDEMQKAIGAATKTGSNKAAVEGFRPPKNPFIAQPDGTLVLQPGIKPTLQFWDAVKRNLDSGIGKAKNAGDKPLTADLVKIKQQLVSYLDQAVPSYKQARAGAAAYFGAEDALTAGANFITKPGADDFHGAAKALAQMSGAEKKLFAEGAATTLVSRLRNNPNLVDTIFLKSPAAKQRIELALGKGAATKLEAVLRLEHLMGLTKYAVKGNSKTAQRLVELGLAGGVGLYQGGGNIFDPSAMMSAALTYGALHGSKAAMARIDANVAREVAKLLASQDPKVVKEAIDRVSRSPGLMDALRIGEGKFSRTLVPPLSVRGGSAAASMVPGAIPANANDGQ